MLMETSTVFHHQTCSAFPLFKLTGKLVSVGPQLLQA